MDPVRQTANDVHAPAANVAAVLTYAADANGKHTLGAIFFSYSAAPTGGRLTVTDGGATVFDLAITGAGPDAIYFDPPLSGTQNAALVITLAAGGGTVAGKLNARHWLS